MTNTTTKDKPVVDFTGMPLSEVDKLIEQARSYKRQRQTNPVLVKGYSESVSKHVDAALLAIAKMLKSEGVAPARWQEVESQLARLQLADGRYKKEAAKVTIRPHKKSSSKQ